ncbi:MAG TPA: ABC-2 family transporter protein [bacterium]|nr:ABC-2 family transporter protein [bacterium]
MGELGIYFKAFKSMLATRFEYRTDVVLSLLGSLFYQLSPLVTYAVIATQVPNLDGWNSTQILFLFGLWALAMGLSELLFDRVWYVGGMVNLGQFDRLLLCPVETLPFCLVTEPQLHSVGNIFCGCAMLGFAGYSLHFAWWIWPLLPFWGACGAVIYSGILVVFSTILIVLPGNGVNVAQLVQQAGNATRFPLGVFPGAVKWILLFVVPLGAYQFLPGLWLFHGGSPVAGLLAPPAAALATAALAWFAWESALNHYESTGN